MKYHYRIKNSKTREIVLDTSIHSHLIPVDGYEKAHIYGEAALKAMNLSWEEFHIEVFPAVGHVAYIHHHPYMEHDYRNDEEYRERNDGYYHQ